VALAQPIKSGEFRSAQLPIISNLVHFLSAQPNNSYVIFMSTWLIEQHYKPRRGMYSFTNRRSDNHNVALTIHDGTGVVVHERWTHENGPEDRVGAPALIERDERTLVVTREGWYSSGRLNRVDGPALIHRDQQTGVAVREYWYIDGRVERPDGPCVIKRDPQSGASMLEVWGEGGLRSRQDGPAVVHRDGRSNLLREEWWLNGKLVHYCQVRPCEPIRRGIGSNIFYHDDFPMIA
jgi:hypothetical protein